jgi:hypothetical protein
MAAPRCSDEEFIKMFQNLGAGETARHLGLTKTDVFERRRRIEKRSGQAIKSPNVMDGTSEHPARLHLDIENGTVIVVSDEHNWPGVKTTMHRAAVKMTKEIKPRAFIANGDMFDGADISRHAPIGWETRPTVIQELEACQDSMAEYEIAAEKAEKIWSLGNHDARFETRLATVAPQYANVHGVHLKDHFPNWQPCWSVFINDEVVVKHRFKGGIHATHNNTLWSGKSIVTGHLHSAKVTPFTDYNGTRWGVDGGTLCEAPWPQAMDYLEDNPVNWRSAFVVLTFHKGRLLQPELCLQHAPGQAEWRGKVWDV